MATKKEVTFWRNEMDSLDRLYKEKMKGWQELVDLYDLKFTKQIRDLKPDQLIKVSRFYPLVRQIIASIAFNYPKLFFSVEEEMDDNGEIKDMLERASTTLMNLMDVKPHVHQAIFDALFCGVGWLRVDYNPPGDDIIAPYVTNDAMHEDLTAINRVAPGFVHLDPLCSPHKLGHARYIREKMWVPLKQLRDDKRIKNARQIQAVQPKDIGEMGFGEPDISDQESPEQRASREAIENGEFVLVDRIHDRMNRKLLMFAPNVGEPILEEDHPFTKMAFPQRMGAMGPLFEEDGITPLLDIEAGRPAPGWIVEDGFPFIPVKFDLHFDRFDPMGHLKYVEDIQYGVVESLSRQANLLKRTGRLGVVNRQEILEKPDIREDFRRGNDGELVDLVDVNNFREVNWGTVPPEQYAYEDRLRSYEEEITRVTDLVESGATPRTATEASLIATQISVNREWMEAAVSQVYENVIRKSFGIMGDPRYTPENFLVNVAPDGEPIARRALASSDFLWEYRITVAAGSTQPLFEQIQQEKFLNFYDRAAQRPSYDQLELDKMLASSAEVDVDRVIMSGEDPEAVRAAQMEQDRIISQQQDPGVIPEQDHKAHMSVHQQYQQHPTYQQIVQAAQQTDLQGIPVNPQAAQLIQAIDALMSQHMQAHQQAAAAQVPDAQPARAKAGLAGLEGTVRGNAQRTANAVEESSEVTDGA